MRIGFNLWYVCVPLTLIVASLTGYLNTHHRDGRRRAKRLYGRLVRRIVSTAMSAALAFLIFVESYRGLVQLLLDFGASEADSGAWADLCVLAALAIGAICFADALIAVARYFERLPAKAEQSNRRYYACDMPVKVCNGEIRRELPASELRRILVSEQIIGTGKTLEQGLTELRQRQAMHAQQELCELEAIVAAHEHAQAVGQTVETAAPLITVVCSETDQSTSRIVDLAHLCEGGMPTLTEISHLKSRPLSPKAEQRFQTILAATTCELTDVQIAAVQRFFEIRPELKSIAVSGRILMTLRIDGRGIVSVLRYTRV